MAYTFVLASYSTYTFVNTTYRNAYNICMLSYNDIIHTDGYKNDMPLMVAGFPEYRDKNQWPINNIYMGSTG